MELISLAFSTLNEILPGDKYGISHEELSEIGILLSRIQKQISISNELEQG